jgi:hypothetical protein
LGRTWGRRGLGVIQERNAIFFIILPHFVPQLGPSYDYKKWCKILISVTTYVYNSKFLADQNQTAIFLSKLQERSPRNLVSRNKTSKLIQTALIQGKQFKFSLKINPIVLSLFPHSHRFFMNGKMVADSIVKITMIGGKQLSIIKM